MNDEKWIMENGKWMMKRRRKMDTVKWIMVNGKWKTKNEKYIMDKVNDGKFKIVQYI